MLTFWTRDSPIEPPRYPVSRAVLDACDRLSVLVMGELTDVWTESKTSFDYSLSFPEWWERDVEAMVTKDVNHPSDQPRRPTAGRPAQRRLRRRPFQ